MISLVVPGSSERMLAKARTIEADEVVIDLEDAVVPERKREALDLVIATLDTGAFHAPRTAVRVNATRSQWVHTELIALTASEWGPDTVILPKVEDAGDLAFVDRLLDGAELAARNGRRLGVQALIETATGIANLDTIVEASERLEAIIIGYADLAVSLGRTKAGAADLDRWLAMQDAVLVAARRTGIRAIDGPYLAIEDTDGLTASSARAAELGFDGKWAIHPHQLGVIRDAFTPTLDEIEHARSVLAALGDAAAAGDGALSLDGEMLDEPVRLAALRTLERAGVQGEPAA